MVRNSIEATKPARQKPARSLSEHCDVLVLDAHLRQSLVTVRSLGRRDLRVAALDTTRPIPAFFSRWCQRHFDCQARDATEDYLAALELALDSSSARVMLPSSDSTIALIRQYRERLESRVHLALAQEPALGIAINKEQTLEIATRLGLKVPYGALLTSINDVPMAVREIGLPAVVKPVESWVWGEQQGARIASQLVTTADEARHSVESLTASGGSVLFQQFLTGRREAVSLFYARGEVYGRFAQWAKRTDPPLGGTSVLRQSIAMPRDIGEQSERLVRAIDLEGYSEVEFRRDSAGVPYLMEINARLSASVEIAVRAGVDFPFLLYQWANNEPITKMEHYQTGLWMRYLRGDLMSAIASLQERGRPGIAGPARVLLDFGLSCFVPMAYDYVNWGDPAPALVATADFTRRWIGSAISKRLSHLRRVSE
jgi:predicted ATP-grasp superfamily ATP-dependent carboligase